MTRLAMLSLVFALGCQAPVGVRNASVPRDAAPQCNSICGEMGLALDSVVVMADNVGCVCRPPQAAQPAPGSPAPTAPAAPTAQSGSSGAAAGLVAIMIQQRAAAAAGGGAGGGGGHR
jgi:hypothetical protein